LAISGSLRNGSYNTALLNVAVGMLAEQGAEVVVWDFRTYPLPIYDANLETSEGLPENAKSLKQAIETADAVLLGCPEYNAGPTPLLKNAIDWTSRKTNEWENKVVAIVSASTGQFGGARGQYSYRNSLAHLRAFVLPDMVTLPLAEGAFDQSGNLTNERTIKGLREVTKKLITVSERLKDL
jgi:NAD(P)H-dependent FMN reductase